MNIKLSFPVLSLGNPRGFRGSEMGKKTKYVFLIINYRITAGYLISLSIAFLICEMSSDTCFINRIDIECCISVLLLP